MSLTTKDIADKLKRESEIDLLEILDIDSEQLVDRFEDKILERLDYYERHLDD